MKSQWECVLENLGEWVGSFTTVTPQGELVEDIPSIIKLAGVRDNQAVHLVLKRFYSLPNSTEKYAKEVVWDFSTPPGIGALYFETGAFSSGALAINIGVKLIAEFSLRAGDRRFRMIQTFDISQQIVGRASQNENRVTFVREHLQGTTAPELPHLDIADLVGTWTGIATTLSADSESEIATKTQSTLSISDTGYRLIEQDLSIDLIVDPETPASRLWHFINSSDGQSYQLLLLPDRGYAITPTKIKLGHAFNLEIGWIHQTNQRQRLVRQYDSSGKWKSVKFITEQIDRV